MSKKLYEENNIRDIANAIRAKNGTDGQYTVAQMPEAIQSIHGDPILESISISQNGSFVPPSGVDGFDEVIVSVPATAPVLETLNVVENGDYLPSSGKDGFSSVHVAVPTGEADPVLQEKTVTQNGVVLPDSGYDGLSKVTVNVSGGSSRSVMEEACLHHATDNAKYIAFSQKRNDYNLYRCGYDYDNLSSDRRAHGEPDFFDLPDTFTASDLLDSILFDERVYEYYSDESSNAASARDMQSDILQKFGAILLGVINQSGDISDSINNYRILIICSMYSSTGFWYYDTMAFYKNISLNTVYFGGMKDRNTSYRACVVFDTETHATVKRNPNDASNNGSAIIYGIP